MLHTHTPLHLLSAPVWRPLRASSIEPVLPEPLLYHNACPSLPLIPDMMQHDGAVLDPRGCRERCWNDTHLTPWVPFWFESVRDIDGLLHDPTSVLSVCLSVCLSAIAMSVAPIQMHSIWQATGIESGFKTQMLKHTKNKWDVGSHVVQWEKRIPRNCKRHAIIFNN